MRLIDQVTLVVLRMARKRILDAKQLEDLSRRKEKGYDFKISLGRGPEKENQVQTAEPRALHLQQSGGSSFI